MSLSDRCPHCGYCPHCGRSNHYYGYPYYQGYPYWSTCGQINSSPNPALGSGFGQTLGGVGALGVATGYLQNSGAAQPSVPVQSFTVQVGTSAVAMANGMYAAG